MRFLWAILRAVLRRWRLGAVPLGLALSGSPQPGARAADLAGVLRYSWAVSGGSTQSDKVEADGNAIDSTGAIIAGGIFHGTSRFTTSLGKSFQLTSRGDGDIFVLKFSRSGELLWSRQFGGPGKDNAFDLTVDRQDNILVSGWFSGEVAFGSTVLKSLGDTDAFLAKLSPAGEVLWAQQMGGAGPDGANEVAVDPQGNILLSAMSGGTFTVGGTSFQNGGFHDAYIIKFAPDGRLIWARNTNGPGLERIRAISSDGLGNVYAGFQVRGTFRIGSLVLEGVGGWDGVMTKWSPSGELLWHAHLATSGDDGISASAGTRDGAAYFAGAVDGRTVIGGLPVESAGKRESFVFKLSPTGRPEWGVTFSGRRPGNALELFTTPNGDVLVSGAQKGLTSVRRNGREIAAIQPSTTARTEATVMLLSSTGELLGRLGPTASEHSTANTCDVGPDGKTFVQSVVFNGDITYGRDRFVGVGQRNFLLVVGTVNRP